MKTTTTKTKTLLINFYYQPTEDAQRVTILDETSTGYSVRTKGTKRESFLTKQDDGTLINDYGCRFVIVKADRRPKPFAIRGNGVDGRFERKFAELAELQKYVQDRWQGVDYIDGAETFHTDYVRYTLTGATLADLGKRSGDGWDWTWKNLIGGTAEPNVAECVSEDELAAERAALSADEKTKLDALDEAAATEAGYDKVASGWIGTDAAAIDEKLFQVTRDGAVVYGPASEQRCREHVSDVEKWYSVDFALQHLGWAIVPVEFDVCIVGNPAVNGVCGDPDCICCGTTTADVVGCDVDCSCCAEPDDDRADETEFAARRAESENLAAAEFAARLAGRIAAVPDWYWKRHPEDRRIVDAGDEQRLYEIEERIEDWRTDPLP